MHYEFCSVTTVGTLIREPRKAIGYNNAVCLNGTLAIKRFYTDLENVAQSTTTFIDWSYWCEASEAESLKLMQGEHLKIDADLHLDTWKSQAGEKRYKHVLKVKKLEKLGI